MSTTTAETTTPVVPAERDVPVNTNAERVYNLTVELARTKQQKKDAAAGFRDEINRLEGEIKDILKSANEDVGTNIG